MDYNLCSSKILLDKTFISQLFKYLNSTTNYESMIALKWNKYVNETYVKGKINEWKKWKMKWKKSSLKSIVTKYTPKSRSFNSC